MTLKVDGGTFDKFFGFGSGQTAAAFVNRLTPPGYPATLQSVQIYFGDRLAANTPIKVLCGGNLSGSANFATTFTLAGTQVMQLDAFSTYTVTAALTKGCVPQGFRRAPSRRFAVRLNNCANGSKPWSSRWKWKYMY